MYCLNVLLGAVLLVAAALKAHQYLDGTPSELSRITSWPFQLLTIETNLALGLWLVSGFHYRIASSAAIMYFLLLAGTSGYMLSQEHDTCGCFGPISITPWATFLFDLLAVCGLLLCPRSEDKGEFLPVRLRFPLVALVILCFVSTYLVVATPTDRRITTAINVENGEFGETVILDVENWEGKRLPILKYLDGAEQLRQGRWTMVLHHQDCEVCERFLRQMAAAGEERDPPLALVEVVTIGRSASALPVGVQGKLYTSLSGWRRWVVPTPTTIELENGNVTKVLVGNAGMSPEPTRTKEK